MIQNVSKTKRNDDVKTSHIFFYFVRPYIKETRLTHLEFNRKIYTIIQL